MKSCKLQSCPKLHNNTNGFCDAHQSLIANRPCRTSGCPNASVFRGYCQRCNDIKSKEYEEARAKEHAAVYDEQWRKLSRAYRVQHPECEQCKDKGFIRQAVLVHHIKPIDEGGDRLATDNLQALCRDCHEKHHGRKR